MTESFECVYTYTISKSRNFLQHLILVFSPTHRGKIVEHLSVISVRGQAEHIIRMLIFKAGTLMRMNRHEFVAGMRAGKRKREKEI